MTIKVGSSAFEQDNPMPRRHAYRPEGDNISPPLEWSNLPAGTKELALICDDPDAPGGTWVHWVMYKIPADAGRLAEGVAAKERLDSPKGSVQGTNSFREIGYGGPMPPRGHGVHHYHFRVYALSAEMEYQKGMDADALRKAMNGHVLAQGDLVGTYKRI